MHAFHLLSFSRLVFPYLKLIFPSVACLIVLEIPHPLGPVSGLHPAGPGPFVCRVKIAIPFERPEFFEPDLPNRPVQIQSVDVPVVTVYAKVPHVANSIQTFPRWRGILAPRRFFRPCRIKKCRYVGTASDRESVQAL